MGFANVFKRDYGDFVQYRIFQYPFESEEFSDYVDDTVWNEFTDCNYSWEEILAGKAPEVGRFFHEREKKNNKNINLSDEDIAKIAAFEKKRAINNSIKRSKDKIYDYAQANKWEYMATFTFKDGSCPYPYPDNPREFDENMKVIKKWFNNIMNRKYKDTEKKLKYILIPELGESSGRFHAHALLANCEKLNIENSGKMDPSGNEIYNLLDWKKGFSTLVPIYENYGACNYILKYITKQVAYVSSGRSRYLHSANLEKAKVEKMYLTEKEKEKLLFSSMVSPELMYYKTITNELGQQITYLAIKK